MPLLHVEQFAELNLVHWRVEVGENDDANPLLTPAMPWDEGGVMAHGTVAFDPIDRKWKAWQISTPKDVPDKELEVRHARERRLTYLESPDGLRWIRPALDAAKWPGYDRTNIILEHSSGGTATYASVIIHPDRKEYPYELFIFRTPREGSPSGTVPGRPKPEKRPRGLYRYRSADAIHWEVFDGPIDIAPSDVCYIYRRPGGGYVAYYKVNKEPKAHNRLIIYDNNNTIIRAVAMRTSEDGSNWSQEKTVLEADWRDPQDTQFLELCPVEVPGGFVAFATTYSPILQTMFPQIAVSRDGINWWMPDRRPALHNPPLGDWGAGMIWQMKDPIVFGDDLFLYYGGVEGLHGEILDSRFGPRLAARGETVIGRRTPTLPFSSALCRARWNFHRLYALVPSAGGPVEGRAVTHELRNLPGRSVEVNVLAKTPGSFTAAFLDASGKTIAGFTRAECQPVQGDHSRVALRWTGGDRAPQSAVRVAFHLHRSFLYGFELK